MLCERTALTASLDVHPTLPASATADDDREAFCRFAAWGLRAVGAEVRREGGRIEAFLPPPPVVDVRRSRAAAGERPEWLRSPTLVAIALDSDAAETLGGDAAGIGGGESAAAIPMLTPRSPQAEWIIDRLHTLGTAVHAAPTRQPASAGEIAERLLPAYRVEGGRIRLAGCSLEDRAFFRIYARSPAGSRPQRFVEWTIDADGRRVGEQVARSLGLDDIGAMSGRPPELPPSAVAELTQLAEQRAVAAHGPLEIVAATLLWCKWASGRLRIEFPAACTEIRFCDWAATLEPPAFLCPETGRQSHAIGITDDGRIAALEEIAVCEETSRRTLRRELVECSASGVVALAELLQRCPITERPVLRRLLATCGTCGEQVSPAAIDEGECRACRSLAVALPSDPRIARVLGEYPALDSWRKWRIAETSQCYVLVGSRLFKRLLVVLDRTTLEPRRVATGGRLRAAWTVAPPEQWNLELGRRETA